MGKAEKISRKIDYPVVRAKGNMKKEK